MLALGAERLLALELHLGQIESLSIADSSVRGHFTKQRWYGSAPSSVGRAIFFWGGCRLAGLSGFYTWLIPAPFKIGAMLMVCDSPGRSYYRTRRLTPTLGCGQLGGRPSGHRQQPPESPPLRIPARSSTKHTHAHRPPRLLITLNAIPENNERWASQQRQCVRQWDFKPRPSY
jgi:hypothetical protein